MLASQKAGKGGRHQQETEPDRMFKLKECCDMLIAGGYFRARMPSQTPFDKVVGGMVWSITASNVGIDVDLLFEENSTIGERIRLSENIVKALIRMQCPTPVQSHQIQGLDYDHILPVLRWQVRKVIETRATTGDESRALSISKFTTHYEHPQDKKESSVYEYIDMMTNKYAAQRKYKKKMGVHFDSEVARVEATLLEYDDYITSYVADDEQADKKKDKGGSVDSEEQNKLAEQARIQEEEKRIKLHGYLDNEQSLSLDKISGSALESLISMRSDDIRKATTAHSDLLESTEAFVSQKDIKKIEEQKHKRLVENLQRRIAEAQKLNIQYDKPLETVTNQHEEVKQSHDTYNANITELIANIEELDQIEQESENKEILSKLRNLVMLNESLKKQEQAFKLACKQQMTQLKQDIENQNEDQNNDDTQKLLELRKLLGQDNDKYLKLRSLLAEKNQDIAKINRNIDEIPTRAELLQFERRFVELYDTVAAKTVETRQYFDLYNTLSNSYHYLQNQLTILESIVENFAIGMKSKQQQQTMLQQFGLMMEGVETSKKEVEEQLLEVKQEELQLSMQYNKHVESQREYFKIVKAFQEECTLNEKLSNAVEQINA